VKCWLVSYSRQLQMFSIEARLARAHLEFCKSRGQTLIFAVLEAWIMPLLHCDLHWEVFYIDFCCFKH